MLEIRHNKLLTLTKLSTLVEILIDFQLNYFLWQTSALNLEFKYNY